MKQDTKQRILQTGARIIHRKGYNHTGIQEVLTAAEVPKGSFYFYFDNKKDFGLQVIDFFNNMVIEMIAPVVGDKNIPPLQRIENLFQPHPARMDFPDRRHDFGVQRGVQT